MLSNYFNNITFYNKNCPQAATNKEAVPQNLYFYLIKVSIYYKFGKFSFLNNNLDIT